MSFTDDPTPTAARPRSSDPMRHHPLVNTVANVVTAVCAVLLAIKVL